MTPMRWPANVTVLADRLHVNVSLSYTHGFALSTIVPLAWFIATRLGRGTAFSQASSSSGEEDEGDAMIDQKGADDETEDQKKQSEQDQQTKSKVRQNCFVSTFPV